MPKLDDYITDVLMRDLVGHDHRPAAFLVYLWMAAEHERRETAVRISYQELAEAIGISRSSVQAAISWLTRRQLLSAKRKRDRGAGLHCAASMEKAFALNGNGCKEPFPLSARQSELNLQRAQEVQ